MPSALFVKNKKKTNFGLSRQNSIAETGDEFLRDFEWSGNSDSAHSNKAGPTCKSWIRFGVLFQTKHLDWSDTCISSAVRAPCTVRIKALSRSVAGPTWSNSGNRWKQQNVFVTVLLSLEHLAAMFLFVHSWWRDVKNNSIQTLRFHLESGQRAESCRKPPHTSHAATGRIVCLKQKNRISAPSPNQ